MLQLRMPVILVASLFFFNDSMAQTLDEYKRVSDSFYYLGKYDSALLFAKRAEIIIKKDSSENSSAYAYFVGQFFSMNYEKLGDMKSAEYWYKKSVGLFEELNDTLSIGYAETLTNLGNLTTNLGAYSEALPYLLKAKNILKDYAEQVGSYGGAVNNLANVYNHTGQYAKAEGNYLEALKLVKLIYKSDENYYGAKLYSNLAIVYNKTGLSKRVGQNLEKACSIFKKIDASENEYYTTYLNLGTYHESQKRNAAAMQIFKEIADSVPASENNALHASALNGLGHVMQQQGKWKEAETHYLSALAVLRKEERKTHVYYAAGYNLALLYAAKNNLSKADSVFRSLLNDYAHTNDRDQYHYLQIFSGFCGNLIKTNRIAEASDSLQSLTRHLFHIAYSNFEGMPQSEKIGFAETLKASFDLVYSLLASGKATNEMTRLGFYNQLQLKGMILTNQTDLYNEVRRSYDTALTAAFQNWRRTQEILYNQYLLPYKKRTFSTDSLENLAEEYERKFSGVRSFALPDENKMIVEKIRKSLLPAEAAIEFVRFNYLTAAKSEVMYAAFILKQDDTEPVFVVLCKEQELTRYFSGKKGDGADVNLLFKSIYQSNNTLLYTMLWKPMEHHLRNSKVVYYSPSGLINSIALNAVSRGDNRLLMDKYNLYFISSAKDLFDRTNKPSGVPKIATVWGKMNYSQDVYLSNPADKQGSGKLQIDKDIMSDDFTKGGLAKQWNAIQDEETDRLKILFSEKHLPYKLYTNTLATEENFKMVTNGSQGIIHISTHGFFAPSTAVKKGREQSDKMYAAHTNPLLRCGLVFSGANYIWSGNDPLPGKDDGILTGYEIAQMDLSKVDLMILSACETGLGDIDAGDEGVIGLQRSFKLAGAKKMIASLWKVPQKQTAELMVMFYKYLLAGQKASEALLLSQREFRKKKYPSYYWAGFVAMQ